MEGLAQAIEAQPDMELVDTIPEWDTSAGAPSSEPIDVLIAEAEGEDATSVYTDLLYRWPRLRVLSIGIAAADGGVVLHELQPTMLTIGNVSLAGLLDAIRNPTTGAGHEARRPGFMGRGECM
jgi:hypothetical protein